MKNKLPDGWKEVNLANICEVKKGTSITKDKVTEGKIPVIAGGQQAAYYHNEHNRMGETITVSGSGAYAGFVAYFNIPIFASDCSTIQAKTKDVSTRYIYYILKGRQKIIYDLQRGIAQPHVYPKDLAKIKIPLPSLPTQNRIVSILEKVEQAKEWRKEADGLTKDFLKSVFLDMFGDSINNPKRWDSKKLGMLCTIRRGASPRPIKDFLGGSVPWIKIGDGTKGDELYIYDTKEKVTKEGAKRSVFLKSGALIFANCGVSLGFARILKIDGCIHDGWLSFENLDKNLNEIYLLKLINGISDYFRKTAPDGTQPNLNTGIMKDFDIPLPPIELQNKFASIVKEVEHMKEQQKKSKDQVDDLFNALIQRAFSGELVS